MIKFTEKPNLPEGKVKTVICGELCSELNNYLDSICIERVSIKPNCDIDAAVKHHADMAAIHLGGNKVFLDISQLNLSEKLIEKGFDVYFTKEDIKGEYPKDIGLNFVIAGKYLIGKIACADEQLLALTKNYDSISVKQGYSKCSCLLIEENAVITDDKSIFETLSKTGFDCLLVSKGDISLPGHEYGFIGGASAKISKSEVLFFGDITKHRDYRAISDFIRKYNCKIVSLNFPLTDFGGIIPIVEEKLI